MWRSQAEAEGLTLLVADNKTGYFGVYHANPGCPKPYQAQVKRGGKHETREPGQLRHRRGGGAVRRTVAGGDRGGYGMRSTKFL